MELATFAKLFSGSVYRLMGALIIGAQPYSPPGKTFFDPGLSGVYGPLRVAPTSGEPAGSTDMLSFSPDGAGGYRVMAIDGDRTYAFQGRLYEDWGARVLELAPKQDLSWDRKTKGTPLLIGYYHSHGEVALTELARERRVFRFYRQKKGR